MSKTAWLVSDFALDDLQALVKLVTETYQAGFDSLAIVAKSFSEQVIAAQGANSRMDDFKLIYLELKGLPDEKEAALEDLALLSGGQVLREIGGHRLDGVKRELPGRKRVGLGRPQSLWHYRRRRRQRNQSRITCRNAGAVLYVSSDDQRRAEILRMRISRLRGGSAVIYSGGSSESEMRFKQGQIKRTIAATRAGLLEGTLPGGGTALLRCLPSLQACYDT